MRTHYLLPALLVSLSLVNCVSKDTNSAAPTGPGTTIQLQSESQEKTGNLSDLFDIQQYIPLETSDASMIGELSKLIVSGDRFWIKDKITGSVTQFTDQGKYISRIARVGKGPGEYSRLSDFTVDGDTVYIWDAMQQKMLVYSAAGEVIRETKAAFGASRVELVGDNEFLFYCDYQPNDSIAQGDTAYNVIVTDRFLEPVAFHLPNTLRPDPAFLMGGFHNILRNGSQFALFESYQNTLYTVANGQVTPAFTINFGSDNHSEAVKALFNSAQQEGLNIRETRDYERANNFSKVLFLQLNDTHLVGMYQKGSFYHYLFYDLQTEGIVELQQQPSETKLPIAVINDIDNTMFYPMLAARGQYFYSLTDYHQLGNGAQKPEVVSELLKSMTDHANPIVVILRPKAIL